jgi:uncharacterized UPF0160 family protein
MANTNANATMMAAAEMVAETHAGIFHLDDAAAAGMLRKIFPGLVVNRVFKPTGTADIVFDIGGGAYDHHQEGKELRDDGIPYAAFGLVWRSFGRAFVEAMGVPATDVDWVYQMVDKVYVRCVDALDNGVDMGNAFTFSNVISSFNPEWDSDENPDEAFQKASTLAEEVLERQVRHYAAVAKARGIVETAVRESDGGIVVLPYFTPWQDHLLAMEGEKAATAKYVVFPSNRGGYNLQAVPTAPGAFTNRAPLPAEWRGKRDHELADVCGVEDAVFVHAAGFIGAAKTLDGAMAMARKSLSILAQTR